MPRARVEILNEIVGAALGTRDSTSGSKAMKARAAGVPFDQGRVLRFELLANHLRDVVTTHPALPADAARRATLPFWEAYFSNFIEGTEFTPDEAERIVFGGEAPRAHPFDDGNGRLARVVMNAEHVAGDEQRAVVPTIAPNDYLRALRRLSRQDRPDLFVTFLDRVRRWTARMDWSTLVTARGLLERTNAFVDANDAEDRGLRLLDPASDDPAITTVG